jgi:hypothetical protein
MILLNNIVEIFLLTNFNLFIFWNALIERINGGFIASAFINRHFVRPSIFFESLSKEGFGGYSIALGS